MQFTFNIWGKCNSGVSVVYEQWCGGDLNKIQISKQSKHIGRKHIGRIQVSWHFIIPVRFPYLGLLRMRTSMFHPFSHAEQQYLMYLRYCKG